ncbi:hypothetical protein N7491_002501 [Penicillium cf. griseofulvum]|uniref:Transposase Tc1-like domain-containing protein n=1 Tax=Penicillium cf. griseofulvum TaxID=2972120 RepID=A0A9W9MSV6_9EURO|nr:hypothetical protein N7472_003314 [Penicillium cf. griseofulvum]KAJ5446419.1 hypothetical protein N7491_002501 [Penicillium cf. griseofulvum]
MITGEVDDIIAFITANETNRRLSYKKLVDILSLNISVDSLRRTLIRRGYNRRIAIGRPDIKEKNILERLEWALEHVNWTREDWCRVIWTDETWVTPRYHRKMRVTRCADKERHPDCLRPRRRKSGGWMFWRSFLGIEKGSCLFWEKEWGWISGESYSMRIAPLMEGFFRLRREQDPIVMYDNAPGYTAKETLDFFEELGVNMMKWPAFLPD